MDYHLSRFACYLIARMVIRISEILRNISGVEKRIKSAALNWNRKKRCKGLIGKAEMNENFRVVQDRNMKVI
jgi:hypothetical protein